MLNPHMRFNMRLYAPLCAFFVVACQTPQPAVQIREVEVPVPQPCLSAEELAERQEPPLVGPLLTGDAAQDLAIVAASALRLRAWGKELFAAHEACAD